VQAAENTGATDTEENDNEYQYSAESLEPEPISFALPIVDENNSGNHYDDSLAYLTSEDDLVVALLSMNVGGEGEEPDGIPKSTQILLSPQQNNNSRETPDTTDTSTSLPEIEFDFGDDTFLVDPDQLYSVFDNESDRGNPENSVAKTEEDDLSHHMQREQEEHFDFQLQTPAIRDDFPLDVDLDTEQLLQELANMSLRERNQNMEGASDPLSVDPFSMDGIPSGTDGLPFYLWCQPCDVIGGEDEEATRGEFQPLDPSLPPITEHQPLDDVESEIIRQAQINHIQDLQELYQSSQRHGGSKTYPDVEGIMRLDHSDPLMQEFESKSSRREDDPCSLKVAHQWMVAFGVTVEEENSNNDKPDSGQKGPPTPRKETLKTCIGHKETIYGVHFSKDGKYIATAGQDATIIVWEAASNKLLTSLKGHDTAYECLRVSWASPSWANDVLDRQGRFSNILASAGADGMVKLWTCEDVKAGANHGEEHGWKCEFELDHSKLLSRATPTSLAEVEPDKPQVYALQFIDHWKVFTKMLKEHHCKLHKKESSADRNESESSTINYDGEDDKNSFLMTSSDEFIHLWEVEGHPFDQQLKLDDHKIRLLQDSEIKLKEVMSLHFGSLEQYGYGVTPCSVTGRGLKLPPPPRADQSDQIGGAFGGERNPQNIIFVFDAEYCPASGLLGVALSDGSLRLVNGRGICVSVLNLPGNRSHLTSFCWDNSGSRLATCVASGHLITWSIDLEEYQGGNHNIVATCTAIMEGGHQAGRPLFGSQYCGKDDNLLVSWGVDGSLCLWGSHAQGNVHAPMAILKQDPGYPIYALDVSERNVAIGGGGNDGGFIGIPMYLADLPDVENTQEDHSPRKFKEDDPPVQKKPKTDD
jgi:WD40 repeat protein